MERWIVTTWRFEPCRWERKPARSLRGCGLRSACTGAEGLDEVVTFTPKSVGRKACLALGPTAQCASPDFFSDGSNLPTLKAIAGPNRL